jgi:biotin transport system substrate-specific component
MNTSSFVTSRRDTLLSNRSLMLSLLGTVVIVLCTQVRIPLPFTPVPITGQTFAILAWPLLFGRAAGLGAVLAYLALGAMGAPVFAGFESIAALWGPTSGYLLAFPVAAYLLGTLRDSGVTRSIAGLSVSIITAQGLILAIGSAVLAVFVGADNAVSLGVMPFLPGDAIKAALMVLMIRSSTWNAKNSNS